MRILFLVTYYRPHLSGLTIAAARRAEALAARGHAVTVLTSREDPEWPLEETVGGVRVVRLPVIWRAGKGVLLAGYRARLGELAAECDAVVLCLGLNNVLPAKLGELAETAVPKPASSVLETTAPGAMPSSRSLPSYSYSSKAPFGRVS